MDLEEVWRIREEEVYPALFGPVARGIFPLSMEVFERFGQSEVDPRWLFYGVFEFAPTESRRSWLYVTSGHSNPWEQSPEEFDPDGTSGVGVEFTFATTEGGDWAIQVLQFVLAFDILLRAGRFPGREYLRLGSGISLGAAVKDDPTCVLTNMVMTGPGGIPAEFGLPSGKVFLTGFTAISDAELKEAQRSSSEALIDRLRVAGFHPVNDPGRRSIV